MSNIEGEIEEHQTLRRNENQRPEEPLSVFLVDHLSSFNELMLTIIVDKCRSGVIL